MTNKSGLSAVSILLLILIIAIPGLAYYLLEWEKPQAAMDTDLTIIGQQKDFSVTFTDIRSGIRDFKVTIVQDQREFGVAFMEFPEKGTFEKTVNLRIEPRKLGIKDGQAVLKIEVRDFSPLKNSAFLEMPVAIDSVVPRVSLLTRAHNVNPGGTCLAVYSVTKKVEKSGVECGGRFFQGYPVSEGAATVYVCYFAVPRDVGRSTPMAVSVEDAAGNRAGTSIPFYVRTAHKFRDDTVRVGPEFVKGKAAQFEQADSSLGGNLPEETFRYLNTTLREENDSKIASICSGSEAKQFWEGGSFIRMPNTAAMALFGDRRTYRYQGMDMGSSVHLGIDLASTRADFVPAANSGIVAYADDLGIYGNTVIIDHGQGIFTLYAHLSSMTVSAGQQVMRGAVIGNTGTTGFAGGDHLHFSVIVGGEFVNPIEWWDAHWIRDNVTSKLELIPM
ncbi:MAG: M23 family metallopeptidase [Desulfomonilia bacterium]|jgi:murein DD-endopeptidase MepM/ murein hydrolase activator NlpD|nr:M23 family metallopeptidase [Deltaproteobacteria bacterium]HPW68390.1 M23 family metallopeptidase [Deltaproteobacteria bacterium]